MRKELHTQPLGFTFNTECTLLVVYKKGTFTLTKRSNKKSELSSLMIRQVCYLLALENKEKQ